MTNIVLRMLSMIVRGRLRKLTWLEISMFEGVVSVCIWLLLLIRKVR